MSNVWNLLSLYERGLNAATLPTRQDGYIDCWKGLKKHFNRKRRNPK